MRASQSTLAMLSLSISFLYILGLPRPASGQTTAVAQVSGTVTDPSGAAVAGAQVTMTETDKGTVHSTVTDDPGPLHAAEPAGGTVPPGSEGAGIQRLHPDRHCAGGQQQHSDQCDHAGRRRSSEQVEVSAGTSMVETKENSVSERDRRAAHQRSAAEQPPGDSVDPRAWARRCTRTAAIREARRSGTPSEFP